MEVVLDRFFANPFCFICGIIKEKFLKGEDRIRLADILNLAGLCQRHKTVARSAFTVAGGTETWYIPGSAYALEYLIGAALVFHLELTVVFNLMFFNVFVISAHTGAGACT